MSNTKQRRAPFRRSHSHVNRVVGVGLPPGTYFGTGFPTENTSYAESTTGTDWTATAVTCGGLFYYDTDADSFGLLFEIENAGTSVLELFIDTGPAFNFKRTAGPEVCSTFGAFTITNQWYLIFFSKPAGAGQTVRYHYTTNGSVWNHGNCSGTMGDFTFTQSRISFAAERISNVTAKGLKMELATWGLWGETTDDATSQTYTDYSVLAAKANQQFFTGSSLISGGNFVDSSANANSETGGNHVQGAQIIPNWFTNFPPTPAAPQVPKLRKARIVPHMKKLAY